jgi:hypothetical protein
MQSVQFKQERTAHFGLINLLISVIYYKVNGAHGNQTVTMTLSLGRFLAPNQEEKKSKKHCTLNAGTTKQSESKQTAP